MQSLLIPSGFCQGCGAPIEGAYCHYCGINFVDKIVPNSGLISWSAGSVHLSKGGVHVAGIVTSERPDTIGEVILQEGMDFMPFAKNGFITWNGNKGPESIIAIPLEVENVFFNDVPALYLRARMLEDSKISQYVIGLIHALEKFGKTLGFGVVGSVLERQGNVITKTQVREIMITNTPMSVDACVRIVKSE